MKRLAALLFFAARAGAAAAPPLAQAPDAASVPVAAIAEGTTTLPAPPSAAAWVKTHASLLLYDSSGTLVDEVGLGQWEDSGAGGPSQPGAAGPARKEAGSATLLRRVVRGGVSADGRFAWSWEKADTVRPGRNERVLSSSRLMRYLGTNGGELFRNELADAPASLDPVLVSDNGETVLVHEHGPDAWIVAVYDFTGNRLFEAHGNGSIEFAELAAGGAYGLIRWHQLDQPPVYTVLNLALRSSAEIPGARLTGSARILSDGRVLVGEKTVFQPK